MIGVTLRSLVVTSNGIPLLFALGVKRKTAIRRKLTEKSSSWYLHIVDREDEQVDDEGVPHHDAGQGRPLNMLLLHSTPHISLMKWWSGGKRVKWDLVEIYAGGEVSTNVAAGNDRVENEEEKDLESHFQKLHHAAAAKHFSPVWEVGVDVILGQLGRRRYQLCWKRKLLSNGTTYMCW